MMKMMVMMMVEGVSSLCCAFPGYREEIASLGLDEVLLQVKSESSDRDAWNMADHGLRILHNFEQAIGRKSSLLDESPHKADPQRKVSLALESQPY